MKQISPLKKNKDSKLAVLEGANQFHVFTCLSVFMFALFASLSLERALHFVVSKHISLAGLAVQSELSVYTRKRG